MSVNQANPRHVLEFTRGQELRGCGDLWQGSKGGTSFHQGVSGSPGGGDVRGAQTLCETRKTNLISLHQFSLP